MASDVRKSLGYDIDVDTALGLQKGMGSMLSKYDLKKAHLKRLTDIRVNMVGHPEQTRLIKEAEKAFEILSDPISRDMYFFYKESAKLAANSNAPRINGRDAPNVVKFPKAYEGPANGSWWKEVSGGIPTWGLVLSGTIAVSLGATIIYNHIKSHQEKEKERARARKQATEQGVNGPQAGQAR